LYLISQGQQGCLTGCQPQDAWQRNCNAAWMQQLLIYTKNNPVFIAESNAPQNRFAVALMNAPDLYLNLHDAYIYQLPAA